MIKPSPDIINQVGLNIFTDTGMAQSEAEAQFLWNWAVKHKRAGVSDNEAVYWFWQMIAWKRPDMGAPYLKIKPYIIWRRCRALYPDQDAYMWQITEAQFRKAVMSTEE
jgi:hypothetical protein